MGITIDYGPIAAAVQMGTQAGRGQYNQQQIENGDKFQSLMNDMQQTANQRRATDMQNALGYAELQSHNSQAQAQLALASTQDAWQRQYQAGELGVRNKEADNASANYKNEASYRNGMLNVRNNANDIAQQRADTGEDRAKTYQQHIDDLATKIKATNEDKQQLGALQAQVKAAHDEWIALQDPMLSKRLGPTKRDDVPDSDYATATQKFNQAVAARDAKLQAITAPSMQQPPPAAPGAQQGPGMQPPPMMGMPAPAATPPETINQALTTAAQAVGIRPADVKQLPAPSQEIADRVKSFVQTQTSDPAQQRVVFYRLMIQAGLDPTKPAVPAQQQQLAPGTAELPMRGQ